jgi:alpha-N-arabinofuranosidase
MIIKLVNSSDKLQSPEIQLVGIKKINPNVEVIVLKSELASENSFGDPAKIKPVQSSIEAKGKVVKPELAPYSLTVVKVKVL